MRPKSRGRISLVSTDPNDYPRIEPNYLTHPDDLKVLIEGLKIVRKIGDSPAFDKFGAEFFDKPFPLCAHLKPESDGYWKCYVKRMTTTDHHPIGTCRMGAPGNSQRTRKLKKSRPKKLVKSNKSISRKYFEQNPFLAILKMAKNQFLNWEKD